MDRSSTCLALDGFTLRRGAEWRGAAHDRSPAGAHLSARRDPRDGARRRGARRVGRDCAKDGFAPFLCRQAAAVSLGAGAGRAGRARIAKPKSETTRMTETLRLD